MVFISVGKLWAPPPPTMNPHRSLVGRDGGRCKGELSLNATMTSQTEDALSSAACKWEIPAMIVTNLTREQHRLTLSWCWGLLLARIRTSASTPAVALETKTTAENPWGVPVVTIQVSLDVERVKNVAYASSGLCF